MNSLAHFSIANAANDGDSDPARKAKRRSLLPQFSRKASNENGGSIAEEGEEGDGSNENCSRRSGSETSRQSGDVEVDTARRKAIDEDRRTMPPPASKLSRPVSMIPPRGASVSKVARGHAPSASKDKDIHVEDARADSLAALTGTPSRLGSDAAAQSSGMKRTGSTRLPQSPRTGVPSIPSRTTSVKNADGLSRKPSAREGHARGASTTTSGTSIVEKRSSAAKQRPLSTVGASAAKESEATQTSPPRSAVMSRGRPGSHMPPPKPAFNTYQQHYSPAKGSLPKPSIPSAKDTRSAPLLAEDEPVSLDIAKQQIELLQLSLLHQASAQCGADFSTSARRKIGRKHTKLRKEYESIRATELVHQRALNLAALESWCSDPAMLVENLQILSLVHSDLEGLTGEGSRHADLINTFEDWIATSQDSLTSGFVQSLPEGWHSAHSSLALKLRSIQRNLGVLRPPERSDDASALDIVLRGCKALVDGMLKELELMIKLEKEVLAKERTRVEEEVRSLVLDDVGMSQASHWVPAWGRVS